MSDYTERLRPDIDQDPTQNVWTNMLAGEELARTGNIREALTRLDSAKGIFTEHLAKPTPDTYILSAGLAINYAEILRASGEDINSMLNWLVDAQKRIAAFAETIYDLPPDDPQRELTQDATARLRYLVDRTCGLQYLEWAVTGYEPPVHAKLDIAKGRINRALTTAEIEEIDDPALKAMYNRAMNFEPQGVKPQPNHKKLLGKRALHGAARDDFRTLGPLTSEIIKPSFA